MLIISKELSAGRALNYHKKEFTSREQNSWSDRGEIAGQWQGRLAARFGLNGPVSETAFARLSQGQHPQTGEQLVSHRASCEYRNEYGKTVKTMPHRAGWDATFSAPKSVSLTALVGGDYRVREAHREAVTAALNALESYTQARNGSNHLPETTGQFIAARFEHDTARPVDGYAAPQLHTHAVIFNVAQLNNGKTRAIQPKGLYVSQRFATAVYQSELMFRLRRLGYETTVGRSGAPEIKGYTQEYLDASSSRSQQIREYLDRMAKNGKNAVEIAAHATRDRKEIRSTAEIIIAHRKLAAEYGHQAEAVVRAAMERARHQEQGVSPERSQERVRESVTFARDRNFEREAVVDERRIVRDALRRGMGEITFQQVRAELESRMETGEFQSIDSDRAMRARKLTTARTIGEEKEIITRVLVGMNQFAPILSQQQAVVAASRHPHLNRAQQEVVEDVLNSRDRVQGIQGVAGAGTTTLSVVRQSVEAQGYYVEGLAPSSGAAKLLRDSGIEASTLQSFLARSAQSESRNGATQRHFYFVDESSLASTRQMCDFLARLGPQDRVLLIGERRRHQGVGAGRPFEQLEQAGMRTAKLDQIVRQKDPVLKFAVELLAQGQSAKALNELRNQGRVREIPERAGRIGAVARMYAASPEKTLIVAADNASRRELNLAVRQELRANGALSEVDHSFRVFVERQDMTGAARARANRYEIGDVVRYSRGSKQLGIEAGSHATVVGVQPASNLLSVKNDTGQSFTYAPRGLAAVHVYRNVIHEFSVGERIQFTAPDKSIRVANRDLAVIDSISPDGRIVARLDNNRRLEFNTAEHRHFDHGYAVTSHSSQGLTAERVLIHADTSVHPDLLGPRFGYLAVSRASHEATIFTDDMNRLVQRLSGEVSKTSALEIEQSQSIGQGMLI